MIHRTKSEERYLPCLGPFASWDVDGVRLNRDEIDGSQLNALDAVGSAGDFVDMAFLAPEPGASRWDPCEKLRIAERRFNNTSRYKITTTKKHTSRRIHILIH